MAQFQPAFSFSITRADVPGGESERNAQCRRLAELVAAELPKRGIAVYGIEGEDDPLWWVELRRIEPLNVVKVGFTPAKTSDRFICLFFPNREFERRWFRTIPVSPVLAKVRGAVIAILTGAGWCNDIRWLTPAEVDEE